MQPHNQVILLMGPTAIGKTTLAIELAKKYPIDIISVDSAMIYKDLNIGTGKPDAKLLQKIPHGLVNILEPNMHYSVAEFCSAAILGIETSIANNRLPLLVGGTMMYFYALINGLSALPKTNINIREQLIAETSSLGLTKLYEQLQKVDPITAAKLHHNDTQRIQRALEVYRISGKTMSELLVNQHSFLQKYKLHQFALVPKDRKMLHLRIEQRFLSMLDQGLLEEVETLLHKQKITVASPSMRMVGYRQVINYILNKNTISWDKMCAQGIAATRQLAKRQLTWLKKFPDLNLIFSDSSQDQESIIINNISF